jgi:DNA polymerase III subunit chi
MGTVMFYQLMHSSAEGTLLKVLPRAMSAGWRVLIRARVDDLARLDSALWGGKPEDFLPHGMAGGTMDAHQPILLGDIPSAGFDAMALLGDMPCQMAEAAALQRVWVLFDGNDSAQTAAARNLWREVSAAKIHAQYWSEEGGTWAMKSAANAPEKA